MKNFWKLTDILKASFSYLKNEPFIFGKYEIWILTNHIFCDRDGEKMKVIEKRDLRKLNRGELFEIIFQLKKNEEALEQKLSEAQNRLDKREILMKEAGSIAEASLMLNDVFAAAQQAVDTYTNSVRLNYSQMEEKSAQAELERRRLLKKARLEADEILNEARLQRTRIEEESEQKIREREKTFQQTVENVLAAHSELKILLEQSR